MSISNLSHGESVEDEEVWARLERENDALQKRLIQEAHQKNLCRGDSTCIASVNRKFELMMKRLNNPQVWENAHIECGEDQKCIQRFISKYT